ncbi:beta-lactamase [Cladophialophora psammophila CBS 110553]|uniref:Beta-lactamase n=1 Tax=Cladophialophora psammophila CBS 110553 TaxID=1182543 RepID=W9WY28_9EURO|nr:beta-lactamase [Cladophialophora psammophila CBS 110553]EXJ69955.1 beta-lactamase [Cladophialophora psammophila CBS 110553]
MEAKLKSMLEAAVKDKKVPGIGCFIIDSKGNFLLKETFGTTHLQDPNAAPYDADTTMAIFSCTKLITTIAALQLVEQGKLSLSDPVEKYVPRISNIKVLESVKTGADGKPEPVLRSPASKPTILQLMTHTAGFTYDFFEHGTLAYRMATGRAPMQYHTVGGWEDFETPLLADPGTKYIYGVNSDWLGFVIQEVSGQTLPDYITEHVCKPLGMNDTGGKLPVGKKNTFLVHFDTPDSAEPVGNPNMKHNESPTVWGGGGFIYSTMNDYAKLLATLLNNGTSPTTGNSILKPETVKDLLFTDLLGPEVDKSLLGEIGASIPQASLEGSFFPSLPVEKRGWSAALLLNHDDLPYGRKSGSGAWAGLGNLYYWIDPKTGIAGMICTNVLPFLNLTVMRLFDELERVAYGHDVSGDGVDPDKRNYKPKL